MKKSNGIVLRVPGSKSYTNRALLVAAFAKGKSVIKNVLRSDDTKYMLQALRKLGIKYKIQGNVATIYGAGGFLKKTTPPLYVGNAGTAMRFLTAALATQPFESLLTGSERMRKRPIGDLLKALRQLGARAESLKNNGCPPIKIKGPLSNGKCKLSSSISSQFLSGLLMASPYAEKPITIGLKGKLVSKPYVAMTLSVMKSFGIKVKHQNLRKFFIKPGSYRAKRYEVEGDASSASYFWGLAALSGDMITVSNISPASLQADIKFLEILRKMGCGVNGINVKGPMFLKALGEIDLADIPDTSLTVAVLCAFAKGVSKLRGLKNLHVKECDRIKAMTKELQKLGIRIRELPDGWKIHGNPSLLGSDPNAAIETYDDHRIAMCFGVLKLFFPKMKIKNPECVSKSYPKFWNDLRLLMPRLKKPSLKNIILTGMRGSGKTTLGKLLAQKLKRRFIDLDEEIMRFERKNIPTIIKEKGWRYFRVLEHKMVKRFAAPSGAVIATGGGTFLDQRNTKLLKKNGLVVSLQVPIKTLQRRIQKDMWNKNIRPSLTDKNPIHELPQIWKERKKIYESVADKMISFSVDQTPEKSIEKILKIL